MTGIRQHCIPACGCETLGALAYFSPTEVGFWKTNAYSGLQEPRVKLIIYCFTLTPTRHRLINSQMLTLIEVHLNFQGMSLSTIYSKCLWTHVTLHNPF